MNLQKEKEELEALGWLEKISPFAGTFEDLIKAVALKNKPIADCWVSTYEENKELFDLVLEEYGLEKIADLTHDSILFFKPQNRVDAIERIAMFHRIWQGKRDRGYLTIEDHKSMGELFGFSEININFFLSWRAMMIMRNYVIAGNADLGYRPLHPALTNS